MRAILPVTLLVTTALVTAQHWSPHPDYQSTLGEHSHSLFGTGEQGRFQFGDGNFRNRPFTLKRVSLRVANAYYHINDGAARTWSKSSLLVGPTDQARMGSTFANNWTGTPTLCRTGAVSWPTILGTPKNPLTNFPVVFPFSRPYAHDGRKDLMLDFTLEGGRLKNGGTFGVARYYLDAFGVPSVRFGTRRKYEDKGLPGCRDSSAGSSSPLSFAEISLMRNNDWVQRNPGRVEVFITASNVAAKRPYIGVIDFVIRPNGVPFGAGCQRLFLGLTPAAIYAPGIAYASGRTPQDRLGFPNGIRFQPSMQDLTPITQFAWADSWSGALKLTTAMATDVPFFRYRNHDEPRRLCLHGGVGSKAGKLYPGGHANPIFKYE